MKKIFGISLVAILAISPMLAKGAAVAGEPVAGNADSPTATSAPKYALKGAETSDANAATAGYVKGAYNALVKGINKTQEEINTLNTGIGTYADSVNHLLDNTATQTGTVATIKNATSTEQISDSSVNMTGVETTSLSATASGTVNLGLHAMDNWENDSQATNDIAVTTNFSEINVNGMTMSAPTTNTATLTKTGIGGTVTVAEYLASLAPNLNEIIGSNVGVAYAYVIHGGTYVNGSGSTTQEQYGITEEDTWGVDFGDKGRITGKAICSTEYGSTIYTNGGTRQDNVTAAWGDDCGKCWCKIDSYTSASGASQSLSAPWVFYHDATPASSCGSTCPRSCGMVMSKATTSELKFRAAVFNSVQ